MNDNKFQLLVLGEALIDLVQQVDGSFMPLLGGSPYNLCCAASLQGVRVGYLNPFSSDDYGKTLKSFLVKSGAEALSPVSRKPTSLAVVSLNKGEPNYGFYREGIADRDYTVEGVVRILERHPPGVLHTGSLMLMPPEHERIIHILQTAKKLGWIISIDVNVRPKVSDDFKSYMNAVMSIAAYADWLKASGEDLQEMGFTNPVFDQADGLAQFWRDKGCQRIALTFGEQGAYLYSDQNHVSGGAPKIDVVDTIGAGDVFWATCLADWMKDPSSPQTHDKLHSTLQKALKAAAITCSRKGCAPPYSHELI